MEYPNYLANQFNQNTFALRNPHIIYVSINLFGSASEIVFFPNLQVYPVKLNYSRVELEQKLEQFPTIYGQCKHKLYHIIKLWSTKLVNKNSQHHKPTCFSKNLQGYPIPQGHSRGFPTASASGSGCPRVPSGCPSSKAGPIVRWQPNSRSMA